MLLFIRFMVFALHIIFVRCDYYSVLKNFNTDTIASQSSYLTGFLTVNHIQCLSECTKNLACFSASFSSELKTAFEINCFLYNKTHAEIELVSSNLHKVFNKKDSIVITTSSTTSTTTTTTTSTTSTTTTSTTTSTTTESTTTSTTSDTTAITTSITTESTTTRTTSTTSTTTTTRTTISTTTRLFNVTKRGNLYESFQNPTVNKSILGYSTSSYLAMRGYETVFTNATYQYVSDITNNHIVIYDEFWNFLSFKSFSSPWSLKAIDEKLFITSQNLIYVTDLSLNAISSISTAGAGYYGIFYNGESDALFVVAVNLKRIDIFTTSLTMLDYISLTNYTLIGGIDGYQGNLYVTSTVGVLVIANGIVVKAHPISACTTMYSIYIDLYGYMALACYTQNAARLYHTNGSNTGLSISVSGSVRIVSFDSNSKLMVNPFTQINIYN